MANLIGDDIDGIALSTLPHTILTVYFESIENFNVMLDLLFNILKVSLK